MYVLEQEGKDYFVKVDPTNGIVIVYFEMFGMGLGTDTDGDVMLITTIAPWNEEVNTRCVFLRDRELYLYYLPIGILEQMCWLKEGLDDFREREFILTRYGHENGFKVLVRDKMYWNE